MLVKEDIEQINFMNWLRYNHPDIFEDTIHAANQRVCSVQQGRLLKRMGVKKGVSDIFMAVPMHGYAGLWIELKSEKGVASKEQKLFLSRMIRRGYQASIVWGAKEAQDLVVRYIQGTSETLL